MNSFFCFIILHYITFDDTVFCCNSILKNVVGRKKIIIVDNGSQNNSGEKLLQD